MYKLTAGDLAAIEKGESLTVQLTKKHPDGFVRVKDRKHREHLIPATVRSTQNAPGGCYAHVWLYANQGCVATSVFSLLKPGDKICFEFYPDAASNGYSSRARIHVDFLRLRVERKIDGQPRTLTFILDESVCPNNDVRMCRGVAFSDYLAGESAKGMDW